MENAHAICEQLYYTTKIPMAIVGADGTPFCAMPVLPATLISPHLIKYVLDDFTLQKRDAHHPLVLYLEPGYFIGVAQLTQEAYCILGIVSPIPHTREDLLSMCALAVSPEHLQLFCDTIMLAPLVELSQLKNLLCLWVHLAGGRLIPTENVLFSDNTAPATLAQYQLGSELFSLREEVLFHVPTDFEACVCSAIEAGDEELLQQRLLTPAPGTVGRMSASPLRQQKYSFISFITLITRAAQRGGLSAETAFALSDVYCQRMDLLNDAQEIQKLTYAMAKDFCAKVFVAKAQKGLSSMVRKCVDYISVHLHEPLRLEELAAVCGLCSKSVSARFKQELGVSMTDYIHREKVREACYLLTHTQHSLSDIACFLRYPSQSYFTKIFKQIEGKTPQEYRDSPRF